MLQYSRYNQCVSIPDEDAFALINFRTGAVMRLTPFQKAIFDRATELSDSTQFVQKLRKAGFLVAYDELRHMRTQAFFECGRGETLALTICPTLACNFACPYCFEKPRNGHMSRETEDLICKFAKDNMEHYGLKKLNVTWYGGEPLLFPEIIERLSERFIELCTESGASYHSEIITNGWFLTDHNIRLLERSNVTSIQITLDGPTPETNDLSRREKTGGSSFTRIMQNIRKLRPYEMQPGETGAPEGAKPARPDSSGGTLPLVCIRCNLNQENAPLFEALKARIDAVAAETGVNIFTYASRMNIAGPASPELARKEMTLSEYAGSLPPEDLIKRRRAHFYRRIFCMAQRKHDYCIDELGNLYKCWEAVGQDALAFGNVKDFSHDTEPGGNIGVLDAYFETLFPQGDEECMACKFFPLCLGGCPHRRIMNQRECILWKDDPDGYALTRYRIWKAQPNTNAGLSHESCAVKNKGMQVQET